MFLNKMNMGTLQTTLTIADNSSSWLATVGLSRWNNDPKNHSFENIFYYFQGDENNTRRNGFKV